MQNFEHILQKTFFDLMTFLSLIFFKKGLKYVEMGHTYTKLWLLGHGGILPGPAAKDDGDVATAQGNKF